MKYDLALPAQVEKQLTGLSRYVRLLRLLRGACLLVFTLAACVGLVFALDLLLDLREEILAPLLAGSLFVLGLVAFFALALPMFRRFDNSGLAAKVEQEHPKLAERLTSTVGLTGNTDPHGTRVFLAKLLDETDQQTQRLVFRHAISKRGTLILAFLAIGSLLLLTAPAIAWPDRAADFGRRFLLSWFAPAPLQLQVTPANGYAALGRPLTISVKLARRDKRIAWPQSMQLLVKDPSGRQKSLRMHGEKENAFAYRVDQIQGSFTYRIQAGSVTSDEYQITAVKPVELTERSPVFTVSPPSYVNPNVQPIIKKDSITSQIDVLQYSNVDLQFKFTRPAVKCTLVFAAKILVDMAKPAEKKYGSLLPSVPVTLSHDRKTGSLTLPILPAGPSGLTLRMEAEHGIATEVALPDLVVRADEPPFFVELPAIFGLPDGDDGKRLADPVAVSPNDSLHIQLKAGDLVGLKTVDVEYCVNDGTIDSITLKDGMGHQQIKADEHFDLRNKVKDGDKLKFRIKVSDNRSLAKGFFRDPNGKAVPEKPLGPQSVYFPAEQSGKPQWLVMIVDKDAKPLEEREIVSQRDEVNKHIADLKDKIIQAREKSFKLEQPSRYQPVLKALQIHRLQELMQFNEKIGDSFKKLAHKTSKIAELKEIEDKAEQIAAKEIKEADKALRAVEKHKDEPGARHREFSRADKQWEKALEKLERMQKFNAQRAKDRLDATKLKQLAQREKELSEQTAKLDKQKPLKDADQKAKLERLKFEQDKIAKQLDQMAQDNPLVQEALQKAMAKEAGELSKKALELAKSQQKLADEANKALQKQLKNLLAEIAKKQQKIADAAMGIKKQTVKDLQARRIVPFEIKHTQEAVQSIQTGYLMLALRQQHDSAQEMDRVANRLGKTIDFTGSPRQVAQQLAARQKALVGRIEKSASRVAFLSVREIKKVLQDLYDEQSAIRRAVAKMVKTLPQDSVKRAFGEFEKRAFRTMLSLQMFNALEAHSTMSDAHRRLDGLVQVVPDIPVNPKDKLAAQAKEALVRKSAKQLKDLAQEQRDLKEELQRLLGQQSLPPQNGKNSPVTKIAKKQKQLEKKAQDFFKKLLKLSQAKTGSKKAKNSAQQASKAGQQANQAMKKTQEKSKQGDAAGTKKSAEEAANELNQAAKFAKLTASQLQFKQAGSKQSPEQMQAGKQANQSLQQGKQQVGKAQKLLGKKQLSMASKAMSKGAQALRDAANKMSKRIRPSPANGAKQFKGPRTGSPGAAPDPKNLAKAALGGKRWGELSGELKTRVLMDMRAQYGAEYARVIQTYFERVADTSTKK